MPRTINQENKIQQILVSLQPKRVNCCIVKKTPKLSIKIEAQKL